MAELDDLIAKLDDSETESKLGFLDELEKGSKVTMAEEEARDIYKMRRAWSRWVLIFIGTIIVFDIILVSALGMGVWSFGNTSIVIAVITDNFLKIVGLGLLIAHNIFKRNPK